MLQLNDRVQDEECAVPHATDLAGCRILVVMPTIPLHGMERKTLHIMKGLRERGADVLFITQKDFGQNIQREVDRIGCRWVTASFDKLLHLPRGPIEAASLVYSWMKSVSEFTRIRRGYRPTHIHIANLTIFLYCWPALVRAHERVVFALPTPPDTGFTGFRRRLNNFIWRYGVGNVCDNIVCNSHFTFSQVQAVGVKMERVNVIYSAAPHRAVKKGDAGTVDRSKLNVAFVGRISADKGCREFVEAASRIALERDDVEFYLAGDYQWRNGFASELISAVDAKGLASRIRFLGEIDDVPELLRQCDLHVCPSICEEAYGLVVLEAKSQSVPSVVFPSGGLKETVSHLIDGYICSNKTSTALYEGMRYFLDSAPAMKRAGAEASRSLTRFSSESAAQAWASLFRAS